MRTADAVVARVVQGRADALGALQVGSALIGPSGRLPPSVFDRFSAALVAQGDAASVAYVEVVPADERPTWEARHDLTITDLTGNDPAPPRERYLPVADVAPEEPRFLWVLGKDLGPDPVFGAAIRSALAAGEARLTGSVTFRSGGVGFGLAMPLRDATGEVTGLLVPTYRTAQLTERVAAVVDGDTAVIVRDSDGGVVLQLGTLGGDVTRRVLDDLGRQWTVDVSRQVDRKPVQAVVALGGLVAILAAGCLLALGRRERERSQLFDAEQRAREQADETARFLLRLHDVVRSLSEATEVAAVADVIAIEGVELTHADAALVFLADDDDGSLRPVAARGGGGASYAQADVLAESARAAFERNEPIWVSTDDAHAPDAAAFLPLPDEAHPLGVIALTFSGRGSFHDNDRTTLMTMAAQAAMALRRVRALATERSSREESDRLRHEAAFLARFGEALERVTSLHERVRCVVVELAAERGLQVMVELSEEILEQLGATTADAVSRAAGSLGGDDHARVQRVPMQARGRRVGDIVVAVREDADESNDLIRSAAGRAAVAIDNAVLYEHERYVSHALQVGLLGSTPRAVGTVLVGEEYRPGSAELEIGGDWSDAVALPSGRVALVVGDVVGHGLAAAVVMSELRGAVRALAARTQPQQLIAEMDVVVASLPGSQMATLAYVELDPCTGRLVYACAGHPPPMMVSASAPARYLWEGRSPPLGFGAGAPVVVGIDHLPPDSALVLFTDGLVERRRESLDVGLDRLAESALDPMAPPRALVAQVCAAVLHGPQEDDACVLAARVDDPNGFCAMFDGTPQALSGVRRRLGSWLDERRVGAADAWAVVLAMGEAMANAVEHAGGNGAVLVTAAIDGDGAVHGGVHDSGQWSAVPAPGDRGRGLGIVRTLMDEVLVDRTERGSSVYVRRHPT